MARRDGIAIWVKSMVAHILLVLRDGGNLGRQGGQIKAHADGALAA
jgi:hypothetical protein